MLWYAASMAWSGLVTFISEHGRDEFVNTHSEAFSLPRECVDPEIRRELETDFDDEVSAREYDVLTTLEV